MAGIRVSKISIDIAEMSAVVQQFPAVCSQLQEDAPNCFAMPLCVGAQTPCRKHTRIRSARMLAAEAHHMAFPEPGRKGKCLLKCQQQVW